MKMWELLTDDSHGLHLCGGGALAGDGGCGESGDGAGGEGGGGPSPWRRGRACSLDDHVQGLETSPATVVSQFSSPLKRLCAGLDVFFSD